MMKTDRFLHTDQISCFDENGIEIDCLNSCQDGAFGSTQPETLNRFNIIDKIVKDQWTGLVWPINANLADFPLTWKESFEFVKEMNHSKRFDRSDWKMPTRKELFSLISHQQINPSLPKKHPFNNYFNGYYWTGTECARLPNQAWYIHMGGARVYRGMKHGSYMVWPVAGTGFEADTIKNRFVKTEHSFFDRLTRRTWLNGKWLDDSSLTWQEALDRIKTINTEKVAGYCDWRLPNIRELESLIDVNKHSPAFSSGCPLHKIQEGYWSGTNSLYETRYAWVLYTQDGAIGVGYKPQQAFYLFAIR